MTKQLYGIIAACMLTAALCTGIYGIFLYSPVAAAVYAAGCIILMIGFVYAYCTKCPIRYNCVHVLMGLMTRLMPRREEAPYTRCDLTGVVMFFGFVAFFPQYWLVRDPALFLLFWFLFIGEWLLTHFTCCRGCGNIFCRMRSDEG